MAEYKSWAERCKDPRWQKLRLQVMERDGFKCRFCRSKEKTLNVHHKWYERGQDPWEYSTDTLLTLCEDCHTELHEDLNKIIECASNTPGERFKILLFASALTLKNHPWSAEVFHGTDAVGQYLAESVSLMATLTGQEFWDVFGDLKSRYAEMASLFGKAIVDIERAIPNEEDADGH